MAPRLEDAFAASLCGLRPLKKKAKKTRQIHLCQLPTRNHTQSQQFGTTLPCWSPAWSQTLEDGNQDFSVKGVGLVTVDIMSLRSEVGQVKSSQVKSVNCYQVIQSSPLPNTGGKLLQSLIKLLGGGLISEDRVQSPHPPKEMSHRRCSDHMGLLLSSRHFTLTTLTPTIHLR